MFDLGVDNKQGTNIPELVEFFWEKIQLDIIDDHLRSCIVTQVVGLPLPVIETV